MNRNELEKKILQQNPELLQTNLKNLRKTHLESWLQEGASHFLIKQKYLKQCHYSNKHIERTEQKINQLISHFSFIEETKAILKFQLFVGV